MAGLFTSPNYAFRDTPRFSLDGTTTYGGWDTWNDTGNIELAFSRPVLNPRLHLFSLSSSGFSAMTDQSMAARLTVVSGSPATPTLTPVSGLAGWEVTDSMVSPQSNGVYGGESESCEVSVAFPTASPFACGTVELTGTVQSVDFSLEALSHQLRGVSSPTTTLPNIRFAVTVDEDLAGGNTALPASYGSASHVSTGLSLGAGVTADATNTASSGSVATVQSTDVNDALSSVPAGKVGQDYTVSGVAVNGLLAGHSATSTLWVDGNRNGTFDTGEKVSVTGGNGNTSFTIPGSAMTSAGTTWLRLRTTENAAQAASATGFADSGEVEDWPLTIAAASAPSMSSPAAGAVLTTTTPTFTGSGAVAGLPVEVRLADGTVVCTVVAAADGSWSCPATVALPQGASTLTAFVKDAGGTSSPAGTSVAVSVDTIAPDAVTLAPSNGQAATGGPIAATDTVAVTTGAGAVIPGSTVMNPDGTFTFTPSTPIADGTTVTVTVTDAAGNAAAPVSFTVDAVAPAAPTVNPTNGSVVRGTAEAGSTVTITDGAGTVLGTTTVTAGGSYQLPFSPVIADGTSVRMTVTDAAGNVSPTGATTVNAAAVVPPLVTPSQGDVVSGFGVAGTTITATLPGGAKLTTTVKPDGTWSIPLAPALNEGESVTVVATNPEGTDSAPVTTTIDQTAQTAPTVAPSNGTRFTGGPVESGAVVTIVDGAGLPIPGTLTVDVDGTFTFIPDTAQGDGSVVRVVVTDRAGNASAPVQAVIDATAPTAASVNPTNGQVVGGTAEAGSTVTITDANGTVLGETVVDGSGTYAMLFTPAIPDGTTVSISVTDAVGNVSAPSTTTVNAAPVDAPVVNPSNGDTLSGTGVAGTTITAILPGGVELTATVKADGTWVIPVAPAHTLNEGESMTVVATNPEGTDSEPVAVVVDQTVPVVPTIGTSNGVTVEIGAVEDCATVTVVDGNGTPIPGTLTTNPDGSTMFTPDVPLTEGSAVSVIVTDAAGNAAPAAPVTVDTIVPTAPVVELGNGSVVAGTGEANSLVTITDQDGTVLGTVRVGADGTFALPFTPVIADGTVLTVTLTDAAGNVSATATTTVDGSAVSAPSVKPSTGETLAGTALPGGTVTATLPDGTELTTTVKPDGTWSILVAPDYTLVDGEKILVTVQNPAGTVSEPVTVVVDQTAPAVAAVKPSNGSVVTGGVVEAGGTVIVLDENGDSVDGELTINPDGTFVFVPATPVADGEVLEVILVDAAGNRSESVSTTVDASAPKAPVVSTTDGSRVTGTAEPGSTITVRDDSGRVIGTGTAGADGRFDVALNPVQPAGSRISISVTDAAGNTTTSVVTVVDARGTGDGVAGGLALTGAEGGLATVSLALLALAAGTALVAARRRRGTRDELSSSQHSL
ncbi:hypothetical protein GCM10022198_20260 [Klugiella xanthotipulae]